MPFSLELVCRGCGAIPKSSELYPFRCPRADDGGDVDHVLRRRLSASDGMEEFHGEFDSSEQNSFVRFRRLLASYRFALANGWTDEDWVLRARLLDEKVAEIDGGGFRSTPFSRQRELAEALGVDKLWVKDETGNVSGSHKARHFMGLALWLEVASSVQSRGSRERLAIASCGNAALGGAIVARAAGWPLDVYVPPWIHPAVSARLFEVGAHLVTCERAEGDGQGDPCYRSFQKAVQSGALPFTCQGNENGLVIEGGQTLIWEIVADLRRSGDSIDRIFVQVGGGALGTACIQGLMEARQLGLLESLPVLHAVQTEGAWPLRRAWRRLVDRILEELGVDRECSDGEAARRIERQASPDLIARELDRAVEHRSEFMWPWEEEPKSLATGILDDETYDWFPIVEGMIHTGGWPIVVNEATLASTRGLAKTTTGIAADATGTAGLAGLVSFREAEGLGSKESIVVLFTGVERESEACNAGSCPTAS